MNWQDRIFNVTADNFDALALDIFHYQAQHCNVYKEYLSYLDVKPENIRGLQEIPFLPIEFFKSHKVLSNIDPIQISFESSGTTGIRTSRHYLTDIDIYIRSLSLGFEKFLGSPKDYCILALLPNYLEKKASSLIFMVDHLMKLSGHSLNGYFLYEHEKLKERIQALEKDKQKTILFGVSFALLDFAEQYKLSLRNTIVMETGGMKGRREEITREALHQTLCGAFDTQGIYSEYGMTELLSQAYAKENGSYQTPPWMRIQIRDISDPFSQLPHYATGGINIIDLANFNSCSFIETQDLGKKYPDNTFSVLGRFDHSDTRGCNLLVK